MAESGDKFITKGGGYEQDFESHSRPRREHRKPREKRRYRQTQHAASESEHGWWRTLAYGLGEVGSESPKVC